MLTLQVTQFDVTQNTVIQILFTKISQNEILLGYPNYRRSKCVTQITSWRLNQYTGCKYGSNYAYQRPRYLCKLNLLVPVTC